MKMDIFGYIAYWFICTSEIDFVIFILPHYTIFRPIDILLRNVNIFSERELTFTFAICYRPSVCLSSVCL